MMIRTMARGGALPLAAMLLFLGAQPVRAQDSIPAEFRGDWVAEKDKCDAKARFRVAENQVTLINGKDTATYGDIGIAHSFFGPDYSGISVVAMPEINSGNSPFTIYFNVDEKKGVTKLEIYQEIKGPQTAQLKQIQDAASKLAKRFPLNLVLLKKCP